MQLTLNPTLVLDEIPMLPQKGTSKLIEYPIINHDRREIPIRS